MDKFVFIIPLISAFIGYVTNYIAIVMLFRPYKEVRFFGIKFFGKGVIPTNHKKLANSIGKTVANELLSSDDILRKLNSDEINNLLKETINSKLNNFSSKEIGKIENLFPYELHYLKNDFKNRLTNILNDSILSFVVKNKEKNAEYFSSIIREISKNSFSNILSADDKKWLQTRIELQIKDKLSSIISKENIQNKIFNYLYRLSLSTKNLNEIIPQKLDLEIRTNVKYITKEIVKQLKILLDKNETKKEIKDKLSDFSNLLLQNANLGMLSMFLTGDFIQEKIELLVGKGIPYLKDNLDSEEYQTKISEFLILIYEEYSNKKMGDLFQNYLNIDNSYSIENISEMLYDFIFSSENSNKIKEAIINYFDEEFAKIINSLSSYVEENNEKLGMIIAEKISEYSQNNHKIISEYSNKIVTFLLRIDLPKISTLITGNDINALSHYILKIIRNQMEVYLPQIFATLDIKQIVTDKVMGFPLPKLEKIIRDVATKELRYITIFGAILGFFIGIIQIIFIYL